MAKFCKICGSPLNKKGLCPNCARRVKKKKSKKLPVIILVASVMVAVAAAAIIFVPDLLGGSGNKRDAADPSTETQSITEQSSGTIPETATQTHPAPEETERETYAVTPIDAVEFLEENGSIVSQTDAADSSEMLTEAEAYAEFKDRAFLDFDITTEYSVDGELGEKKVIDAESDEKHPVYQTYYFDEQDRMWIIYLINGQMIANPVEHNTHLFVQDTKVYVSEKDTIISYDSTSSAFYEIIPDDTTIIKVDGLTASALDEAKEVLI